MVNIPTDGITHSDVRDEYKCMYGLVSTCTRSVEPHAKLIKRWVLRCDAEEVLNSTSVKYGVIYFFATPKKCWTPSHVNIMRYSIVDEDLSWDRNPLPLPLALTTLFEVSPIQYDEETVSPKQKELEFLTSTELEKR